MPDIMLHQAPYTSLRLPLVAGVVIALVFFAGFGGWAATAPLAGAAIAPAVVVPDGSRKVVQHLEGGIVHRILVRDSSEVAAGQPLIELDSTRARAEHAALLAEWRALRASEVRLLAEQTGAEEVRFPDELLTAAAQDASLARVLASQADRLVSRRAFLADQRSVLTERAAQAEAEIDGLEAEITSSRRQLELIRDEIDVVEGLLEKGFERKPRLLELVRAEAQINGTIGASQAAVARARQEIAETRQQMRTIVSEHAEAVSTEMAETRKSLSTLEEKLHATADRLARTVITAPVAGTVMGLRIKTAGGVINPGEPLMEVVPSNADLLLEARVAPVDIDEVHAGLRAQVHLLAYKSRNLPRLEGTVMDVSADRLDDSHTRETYYLARVAVQRSALPIGISLTPGMPADVMIVTSERTLLDYLMQPITDTLRRGLRES